MSVLATEAGDLIANEDGALLALNMSTAPTNLSFAPVNRYRADSITVADGAVVPSWPALGTTGGALTQGTVAAQPTFLANAINGRPAVRFDGVDDVLFTTAAATQAQPCTWYIAYRHVGPASSWKPFLQPVHANGLELLGENASGPYRRVMFGGNGGGFYLDNIVPDVWVVVTIVFNTTATTAYVNGTQVGPVVSIGAGAEGPGFYVGSHATNDRKLKGDVLEVVTGAGAHDAATRTTNHAYFNNRYGIPFSDVP